LTVIGFQRKQLLNLITPFKKESMVIINRQDDKFYIEGDMSGQPQRFELSGRLISGSTGINQKVGFNSRYLHDAIASSDSEYVEFFINGSRHPVVIKLPHTHLIMPMKVEGEED
jgi:hypothetical protein